MVDEVVRLCLGRLRREVLWPLLRRTTGDPGATQFAGAVLARAAVAEWNTLTLDGGPSPSVRHNADRLLADAASDAPPLRTSAAARTGLVRGLVATGALDAASVAELATRHLTPTAERADDPAACADAWRGLREALRVCRDATVASVVAQLAATTWEEDHDRAVERALPEAFAEAVRTLRRANHDDDHDHDHNDDDGELRNDAVLFTASTTIQTLRNTSV